MKFEIKTKMKPAGDQPKAIKGLVSGLRKNMKRQTLLGVTGSGKTFTIANVIEQVQKPTLVLAHNKTLAAQLCNEFREVFPDNAVEYFVSYYDYYQPEAYIPHSDTYIEKETQINEEIDRLRHACTQALLTRRDVIIVASVSAIYGLGSPAEYEKIVLHLLKGQKLDRRGMMEQLIAMQFQRTNADLKRGMFRMRGQVFEIMPVNEEMIYRFEISNHIDRLEAVDPVTRAVKREQEDVWFFPARHYVANQEIREQAFDGIKKELEKQMNFFLSKGKIIEAERMKRRVNYDLAMIKNIGYCNGIENYSRHFDGRSEGEPPFTLLDYFMHTGGEGRDRSRPVPTNGDFLTIIDESHVTIPQIRGMYHGDRARKDTLVDFGFRLPSARDNRPLTYDEFNSRIQQVIYTSATPDDYELRVSEQIVEQIVRPTGLVDPEVVIRPITGKKGTQEETPKVRNTANASKNGNRKQEQWNNGTMEQLSQIEDLIIRIEDRISKGERALVTTLTKRMAEDLTEYLKEKKFKATYLHSDIGTLERIQILTDLRKGNVDVIVGVNLLREGLDLPEVSLVAILDADKEGFLRSKTSLIQTIGRAARNVNGQVILYADNITGSIKKAVSETERRRKIQLAYNKEHGITPKTIEKTIRNILEEFGVGSLKHENTRTLKQRRDEVLRLDLAGDARPIKEIIKEKELQMRDAAKDLDFEVAAILRDEIKELKKIKEKKESR